MNNSFKSKEKLTFLSPFRYAGKENTMTIKKIRFFI